MSPSHTKHILCLIFITYVATIPYFSYSRLESKGKNADYDSDALVTLKLVTLKNKNKTMAMKRLLRSNHLQLMQHSQRHR